MARTALTGAVNVVRSALMDKSPPIGVTKRVKNARKHSWEHRATVLLAHWGDSQAVRAAAQELLKSKFA